MNELRRTLAWVLLLGPLAALAQTGARPDPTDPRLSTPTHAAESAFAGYRGFRDEPLTPWREVNDEVRRLGGHAGHVRDAEPTKPAADKPASSAASSTERKP